MQARKFTTAVLTKSLEGYGFYQNHFIQYERKPGSGHMLTTYIEPHIVHFHDKWWNSKWKEEVIYVSDLRPTTTAFDLPSERWRMFAWYIQLEPTYKEYHIKPEPIFRVIARVGGLVTLLGVVGFVLNIYNTSQFQRLHGKSVELERFLKSLEYCEEKMAMECAKTDDSTTFSDDEDITFIPGLIFNCVLDKNETFTSGDKPED